MKIHVRHRADVGKNRRRGRPIGEQIDFRRTMRTNQRGSQGSAARRHRHRNQVGERPPKFGQVRRLRMPHLRFECVCDHAELVAHRRLIDYFQRTCDAPRRFACSSRRARSSRRRDRTPAHGCGHDRPTAAALCRVPRSRRSARTASALRARTADRSAHDGRSRPARPLRRTASGSKLRSSGASASANKSAPTARG